MKKTRYDLLYLIICGIHNLEPRPDVLQTIQLEDLYKVCRFGFLENYVGTILENAGVTLSKEWKEAMSKAIRKQILFDAERGKLLSYMEENSIWYLPLKGIVLKDYYPAIGMRQMSDNDILFDATYAESIRDYMKGQGYEVVMFDKYNHDVYEKPPIYNFEMHRTLFRNPPHDEKWVNYYENIKERLVKEENKEYGYFFTDEDFYVYIITHEYKHYSGGGVGLRSLLDVCLYLKEKLDVMDFAYINRECEKLGIAEFEKLGRNICKKLLVKKNWIGDILMQDAVEKIFSMDEIEALELYLNSGVYGTFEQRAKNMIQKYHKRTGKKSRFSYCMDRLFPRSEDYQVQYPIIFKYSF